MFYKKLLFLLFAFAVVFLSCSQPHNENEVVEEIIRKNIDAMGGYENLKSVKTVLSKLQFIPLEDGVRGGGIHMLKLPDKVRSEHYIYGKKVILAFNGKKSWMINYVTGNNKLQEVPRDLEISIKESMDFHGPLFEYKKKGNEISLMGKDRINGKEVYKLKIITKNKDLKYYYIDSSTFLILKESHIKYKDGKKTIHDVLRSNYKEVDGIVMNFKSILVIDGKAKLEIVVDKIEINIDLDDSLFERPSATK